MSCPRPGRAPDYTRAALAMGLVNLLWMLGLIWAVLGLPAVLLLALILNCLIDRLAASRRM
ncbi:histidinol phosphate aminotransferase [Roseivivax halodurans JCM 10272]|uniref:Histidinol phosphate aminotransferase n=1 Tax=Roseivivax halodurans JCM 10272 TaxID=1449350 RepID=X7EAE1_9RHOB|nr:hypothetical protein [Roseivivax halodurans]ETX13049.1 histidinol phosphate aminotransferase [Roseivivax halodurans JCM 10272]